MLKKVFKVLAILPVLLWLIILASPPVAAADLRHGDTVIIASGDVIDNDLYIAATRIIINGTVNGDVMGIGETINVNGKINGSITAVGGTISIDGEITHAVRVAGDKININGLIGGDLLVAGSGVNLARSVTIGRDLGFAARKINIDALIEDSIKGVGGEVNLANRVKGNIDIGVDRLTVSPSANIQGDLVYSSDNEAVIQPGAQIGGKTTHTIPQKRQPSFPDISLWGRIIPFLMTLVTGCLIILVAPVRAEAVAASIKRKPWLSLGWGAVILFAVPVAAVVTLITIVGIPIGLAGLAAYVIAIYLSQIAVGLFLGYWIMGYFSKVGSRGILVGAFALGFVILSLLMLIPYAAFPLGLATALLGLGGMALSQRTLHPKVAAVAAPEISLK